MTDWSDFDKKLDANADKWSAFDAKMGPANAEQEIKSAPPPTPAAPTNTPMGAGFFGQNALLGLSGLLDIAGGAGFTNPLLNSIDPSYQTRFGSNIAPVTTLLEKSGVVSPENANPTGEIPKLAAAATRGLAGQLPIAALSGGTATLPGLIKLGAQGALGGVGSEFGQEIASKHPIIGGALGALVGGLTPNIAEIGAAKAAGLPASLLHLQTPEVNPAAAGPLQDLMKSGIEPSVNQLFPAAKRSLSQQEQINSALAKSFGENATDLKADTFANAAKRIGASFDDVAAKTPFIPLDQNYSTELNNVQTRLNNSALSDYERAAVQRMIDNVHPRNNIAPNQIVPGLSGDQYQQFTKSGGQLSDLLGNDNSTVKGLAQNIRSAMDDAMERAAPPDVADQLRTARTQYKNMLMAKDFKPDAQGNVDPGSITTSRVSNYYPNFYKGGINNQDDLENLLRGASLLKTPEAPKGNSMFNKLLTAGVGGAGTLALEHGLLPNMSITDLPTVGTALGVGGLIAAAPKASRALLDTDWYKNQLLRQALGQTPTYNPLASSLSADIANQK
jgi:hypothetical protein